VCSRRPDPAGENVLPRTAGDLHPCGKVSSLQEDVQALRVDVEVNGRKITAAPVASRDQVETPAVVLDCRRSTEIPTQEAPTPAEGLKVVRLPLTAETLSEQDMDQARREFARSPGPFLVLSQTGFRAATVVLAHAGRVLGWKPEEALSHCPGLEANPLLVGFLTRYLVEHSDRSVRRDGNFPA
jgi:hypothetical protein